MHYHQWGRRALDSSSAGTYESGHAPACFLAAGQQPGVDYETESDQAKLGARCWLPGATRFPLIAGASLEKQPLPIALCPLCAVSSTSWVREPLVYHVT